MKEAAASGREPAAYWQDGRIFRKLPAVPKSGRDIVVIHAPPGHHPAEATHHELLEWGITDLWGNVILPSEFCREYRFPFE